MNKNKNEKREGSRRLFVAVAGKGFFCPSNESLPEEKRAVMNKIIEERKSALDALAKY